MWVPQTLAACIGITLPPHDWNTCYQSAFFAILYVSLALILFRYETRTAHLPSIAHTLYLLRKAPLSNFYTEITETEREREDDMKSA
jgi:hypothetical protein